MDSVKQGEVGSGSRSSCQCADLDQRTDAPAVAEAAESEGGNADESSDDEPTQKEIMDSIRQGEVSNQVHLLVKADPKRTDAPPVAEAAEEKAGKA
jgi:hypothetical protein